MRPILSIDNLHPKHKNEVPRRNVTQNTLEFAWSSFTLATPAPCTPQREIRIGSNLVLQQNC